MLVARICQLYPNAVAGAIVSRFFVILYQWCVTFCRIHRVLSANRNSLQDLASACPPETNRRRQFTSEGLEPQGINCFALVYKYWLIHVQLYPADRAHRMPIITPAFPSMCATHNVCASTQMIMTGEFKKGMIQIICAKHSMSNTDIRLRDCRKGNPWASSVV